MFQNETIEDPLLLIGTDADMGDTKDRVVYTTCWTCYTHYRGLGVGLGAGAGLGSELGAWLGSERVRVRGRGRGRGRVWVRVMVRVRVTMRRHDG